MADSRTQKYGELYWCVKTKLSKSGEIYVMADDARLSSDGSISFIRLTAGKPPSINLAIAPGNWTAFYAANLFDGAPVAVEHWDGEINR
jgi:hypothetical protein